MKMIKLTKDKETIVDDEDYEYLSQFKWQVSSNGYAVRWVLKHEIHHTQTYFMHRLLLKPNRDKEIDHINGDKLDNRKENLRITNRSNNAANCAKKKYKNNTSQFKGVGWYPRNNCWRAVIRIKSKYKHLGYFSNEIDAAKAYNKAAIKHFKQFANLNKVD